LDGETYSSTQRTRPDSNGRLKLPIAASGSSLSITMLSGQTCPRWALIGYCTSSSLHNCTSGRRTLRTAKLSMVISRWAAWGVASMKCSRGRALK